MTPDLTKIDATGNYSLFRGVTVIAKTHEEDSGIWTKIHKNLSENSFISNHYSMLPVKSLHMTTMDLFTEKWSGMPDWNIFITNGLPWFQKLNESLEFRGFEPQGTVRDILVSGVIMALINLDSPQKEKIHRFAADFDLVRSVPREFHVTLGYLYKNISSETQLMIKEEVQRIVQEILISMTKPLVFEKPRLNYFYNMTDFLTWGAEGNPF